MAMYRKTGKFELFPKFSQGIVDGEGYVFAPVFVIELGEITAKMYAATFLSSQGGSGHGPRYGQHVLTLPTTGVIENFVHNVMTPKLDYIDSFG